MAKTKWPIKLLELIVRLLTWVQSQSNLSYLYKSRDGFLLVPTSIEWVFSYLLKDIYGMSSLLHCWKHYSSSRILLFLALSLPCSYLIHYHFFCFINSIVKICKNKEISMWISIIWEITIKIRSLMLKTQDQQLLKT